MKKERRLKNPLVALLVARMGTEGLSVSALADKLGISQGYLSQLLREDKLIAATGEDFIRQCANYLRLPAISCFLLAGRLIGADFYKPTMSFKQMLEDALLEVSKSVVAQDAAVSHEQLLSLPIAVQHFVVLQHEKGEGVQLLDKMVTLDELQHAWQPHLPFTVTKVSYR